MTYVFLVKQEVRFLGNSGRDYSRIQGLTRPQRIETEESQKANQFPVRQRGLLSYLDGNSAGAKKLVSRMIW